MNATSLRKWLDASDEWQVPFMLATRKVLNGTPVSCPRNDGGVLRYYFHVMDRRRRRGTVWAWCPVCHTTCHLPRVSPTVVSQIDPYADLSLDEFAQLEIEAAEPFMDRLNRLWEEERYRPG